MSDIRKLSATDKLVLEEVNKPSYGVKLKSKAHEILAAAPPPRVDEEHYYDITRKELTPDAWDVIDLMRKLGYAEKLKGQQEETIRADGSVTDYLLKMLLMILEKLLGFDDEEPKGPGNAGGGRGQRGRRPRPDDDPGYRL